MEESNFNGLQELAEKAAKVHAALKTSYPQIKPMLVFRNDFELLIAVILSAQTTDAQVNKVTPALFAAFPGPESMADASLEVLEGIVHSTGFFRAKARNIKESATILRDRFGSTVPKSMEGLLSLPGVGRKTANVVRYSLFNLPAIIVDTHFGRVVRRLGLTRQEDPEKVEEELLSIIEESEQGAFSMRINYHGRDCCHARKPGCGGCPLRSYCSYAALLPEE